MMTWYSLEQVFTNTNYFAMSFIVSSLHYYPVKSCSGISVNKTVLSPTGFEFDRLFMLVDRNGVFISQRSHPKMALIEPFIENEVIRLKAPGFNSLSEKIRHHGPETKVRIWKDHVLAVDQDDIIALWFSEFLGINCKMVHLTENNIRHVSRDYARSRDDQVSFADGFPFLLTSEPSLKDLNSRLITPLPMNRFRPNIVISGASAFAEDNWKRIKINDVTFQVAKPCARCVVTTIDQKTAEKGNEPLRTLARYRLDENTKILFGQNLIHENLGTISVGDVVRIIEYK